MRTRLKISVLLCAFLALSLLGLAQHASQKGRNSPTPATVGEILDRYETALGGQEAWSKLNSRVAKGKALLTPSGRRGVLEIYQRSPDRALITLTFSDGGVTQTGFDGKVGWMKDPVRGLRRLKGHELAEIKINAAFNSEMRTRDLYPEIELIGTRRIGARETYVLRAVPVEGSPKTMYFDAATSLLVRLDFIAPIEGQPSEIHIDEYCELKEVEIKYPCRFREIHRAVTLVWQVTQISHNVPLSDTVFAAPSFDTKIRP